MVLLKNIRTILYNQLILLFIIFVNNYRYFNGINGINGNSDDRFIDFGGHVNVGVRLCDLQN